MTISRKISGKATVSALVVLSLAGFLFLTTERAQTQVQGSVPSYIKLQATTPGTMQTGHGNISGRMIANAFEGNGASLTNLDAGSLTTGLVADARLNVGGDLNGFLSNVKVSGLRGRTVSPTAPVASDFLQWNGTSWAPGTNGSTLTNLAWANLTGVPSGFADGVDNVTNYTAGNGISIAGNTLSVAVPLTLNAATTIANSSILRVEQSNNASNSTPVVALAGVNLRTSGTAQDVGVMGETNSVLGRALFGHCIGNLGIALHAVCEGTGGTGVQSEVAGSNATGVYSEAKSTTGNTYGVWSVVNSPTGISVLALSTSATGTNYGVYASSDSASGFGVLGLNDNSTSGIGVKGLASGSSGIGINGVASSPSGSTYGVYGQVESDTGRALFGLANSSSGVSYGLRAESNSTIGRGVYGQANSASGVNYGVRGSTSSTSGFGVYSVGDFGASGNKAFRIDHPLDPANKYLMHYSAEGPLPQNIYNGIVTTDGAGYAWVDLPDYYQSINKDPRYTLTVIDSGDDFVMSKVTKPITGNRFQIRTSKPGVQVSWEVKATRWDAYNQARQPQTEVMKGEGERGKYQHPELYGFGPEKGMDYSPAVKAQTSGAILRPRRS